jgi:hypothetical protein
MARYAIKHVPSNRFLELDDDLGEFVLLNPNEKIPTFGQKSKAEAELEYYKENTDEIENYIDGEVFPISEFGVVEV